MEAFNNFNVNRIESIIFDLGGVIIDLSVDKTIQAFSRLSGMKPEKIAEAYLQYPEFFAYEKGQVSNDEFRSALKRIFSFDAPDSEIDRAWNAMLVDLPGRKLDLLSKLKQRFKLSVLSNTNQIHLDYVNKVMLPEVSDAHSLDFYFHDNYYSHLVGMRKPEPEIFEHVLDDSRFAPQKILFLDDNPINLKTASEFGIHTKLIKDPAEVNLFFKNI